MKISDEDKLENKYSKIPYSKEQKESERIKSLLEKAHIKNKTKKKIFIAYGNARGKYEYGMEVHIIYADDIEEAINICPIPKEEVTVKQIYTNRKNSGCEKICNYYE